MCVLGVGLGTNIVRKKIQLVVVVDKTSDFTMYRSSTLVVVVLVTTERDAKKPFKPEG